MANNLAVKVALPIPAPRKFVPAYHLKDAPALVSLAEPVAGVNPPNDLAVLPLDPWALAEPTPQTSASYETHLYATTMEVF